jgi:hypothetical protein
LEKKERTPEQNQVLAMLVKLIEQSEEHQEFSDLIKKNVNHILHILPKCLQDG